VSRIAGVARRELGAAADPTVEQMLSESLAGSPRAGSVRAVDSAGGAGLGWIGSGAPNLHASADVTCAVDGRVYNRPVLGNDDSDAALVARLYREHGFAGTLERLNGDFAIALRDHRDGTLWLARDRFGIRPLYYVPDPARFAFASRPRAIFGSGGASKALDRTFVGLFAGSHYRYFDNDPARSPYEEIAQLPAAHLLEVTASGIECRRWWGLEEAPDLDASPEELADRYRELLLDAVSMRLDTAGAPAFTLSGGMDSSTVLASSVHLSGRRQHAYSTLYSGSEYDESEEIRSMLRAAVEQWHQVPVDEPDVIGMVAQMVEAHDEPVATATWLSHYVLCGEVADAGFDTLFGGLGGDELNAGEYEYFIYRFADLRAAGDEQALRHEVEQWQRHHDHPIFRKDWDVMEANLARFTDSARPGVILPDRTRIERYRSAIDPSFFDLGEYEPTLDHPFSSYLKNRTYQDLFRETAPCCLRAEDRQTQAFGLRNCDPFFDHRLAEMMFRVPGDMKIRDGVTKRLLRESTRGLLPEETRTRIKKTGWNAPADLWFSGTGRDVVLELVESPEFRGRGIYRVDEVRRLLDEHDEIVSSQRPAENHMMFFWQLVNLELWQRSLDAV
jgi:asparagine synthase (glutamine-hydrolysing)